MTVIHSRRRSRNETRNRILNKADELFRQYGFTKTTVADIARDLGMSPANIYKFFPSKNAIVQACADRNLSQIRQESVLIARSSIPATERIRQITLMIYRFHRNLFRNEQQIFRMVSQAVEEDWEAIEIYHSFLFLTFKKLIQEGMRSGEVRNDNPDTLTTSVLDALHIALHPHIRHSWNKDESEDRVRAHVDLVIAAVR